MKDEKYSTLVLVFLIREIDYEKIKPADDVVEAKFFKFNKLPDLAFENQSMSLRNILKTLKNPQKGDSNETKKYIYVR